MPLWMRLTACSTASSGAEGVEEKIKRDAEIITMKVLG